MANDETGARAAAATLSLRLRHSLVITVSSLVIRTLALGIRAYQLTISPAQALLFGAGGGCRFTPTCSAYALDAVREHGAAAGTVLATKRICRCHPWGGAGHDPVSKAEGGRRKTENEPAPAN